MNYEDNKFVNILSSPSFENYCMEWKEPLILEIDLGGII
jgi:hypothetical protein